MIRFSYIQRSGHRWASVLQNAGVDPEPAPRQGAELRVFLVCSGGVNLMDFSHPQDAVYVCGPDLGEPPTIPQGALTVTVPGGELFAVDAAAIVLWDRRVKQCQ